MGKLKLKSIPHCIKNKLWDFIYFFGHSNTLSNVLTHVFLKFSDADISILSVHYFPHNKNNYISGNFLLLLKTIPQNTNMYKKPGGI